jgi:hypothetical protein
MGPPRGFEPQTFALRVVSMASIQCSTREGGPWTRTGVHDRPVHRLLAWLLTLSAG